MKLKYWWNVWLGWMLLGASLVLALITVPPFVSDARRVFSEFQSLGHDERLSDVRPEQSTWLLEQNGGRWGQYGWYLDSGQEGALRVALPGVQSGILKLRLWAFSPGGLSVSVKDGTASHEISDGNLDGRVLQLLVDGPTELVIVASSNVSAEQLVLDRFAAVWFPSGSNLPSLWPLAGVITLGLGGWVLWMRQHGCLFQGGGVCLGFTGIVIAFVVGFLLRWALFDIARALPPDPDAVGYRSYARSLEWFTSAHGFYSGTFGEREPFHVGALNLWSHLWGESVPAMRFYTVCLSTLLILGSGLFMWGLTGRWLIGVLGSWTIALSPAWIDEAVRGLRLESLTFMFLAVLGVWFWARGWLGVLALGVLTGSMALIQSPALGIVLPLLWFAWLLNLWQERYGFVLVRPSQWHCSHLMVVSLVSVLMYAPHLYGLYKVHGDPSWPSYGYARWNANVEFQDRLGTAGFPSIEEFKKTPYAGPHITYREYLFGMHSISQLLFGHIKGWVESSIYMTVSHAPQIKQLIFLHHASGFRAVFRHLTAVTSAVFILSIFFMTWGWLDLWRRPQYWWVPFLSLWGTWYAAYLYSVRVIEPFRHTGHVYPLLLLCLLWGSFQAFHWLKALLLGRVDHPSVLHLAERAKQERA